jgi:hypothetical protein
MATQIKAACGTYIRALLTILLTLMATIGKSPIEFAGEDWKMVANGLWASLLPVIMRALSTTDDKYGRAPKE